MLPGRSPGMKHSAARSDPSNFHQSYKKYWLTERVPCPLSSYPFHPISEAPFCLLSLSHPKIRLVSCLLCLVDKRGLTAPSLTFSLVGRRGLSSTYLPALFNVSEHGFRRRWQQFGPVYISATRSEYLYTLFYFSR